MKRWKVNRDIVIITFTDGRKTGLLIDKENGKVFHLSKENLKKWQSWMIPL